MSEDPRASNRPVWLAIIIIVAILVASGTAVIYRLAHADVTSTVTAAGAAFVATVTLCVTAWNFLVPHR